MTEPEDALDAAREAAAAVRARGGYADDLSGFTVAPTDAVTPERLLEWALIEPDPGKVYSTRRFGAPITGLKRALLRVLHQYHNQLTAQQTRFNIQATVYMGELADRVRELEQRVAELERGGGPPP